LDREGQALDVGADALLFPLLEQEGPADERETGIRDLPQGQMAPGRERREQAGASGGGNKKKVRPGGLDLHLTDHLKLSLSSAPGTSMPALMAALMSFLRGLVDTSVSPWSPCCWANSPSSWNLV